LLHLVGDLFELRMMVFGARDMFRERAEKQKI